MRKISASMRAWWTSSSLSGGMMATISFMSRLFPGRLVQVQQAVAVLTVQLVVHARHLAGGAEPEAEHLLHEHDEPDGQCRAVDDRDSDAEDLDTELREG